MLTVLDVEDTSGLPGLGGAFLDAPPGTEWDPSEVVGDGPLAGRLVGTLSGGERQRLRLARWLASPGELLVVDEPLGYLDAAGRAWAVTAMREAALAHEVVVVSQSFPIEGDRVVRSLDDL